ncbi:MAG: hypothetical protein AAF184_21240 [Pseudomonadota bacterium]
MAPARRHRLLWTAMAALGVLSLLAVGHAIAQNSVSLDAPATLPADI